MGQTDVLAPPGLETRARAAFTRGRLRLAAATAVRAALLPIVVLLIGQQGDLALAGGLAFTAVAAAFAFHGRAPGHAVGPGLLAGAAAVLCPLLMRTIGHACGSAYCMSLCVPACVVGGAAAGALVALRARSEHDRPATLQTLLSGAVLVALAAPMGCAMLGSAGLVATAAGMLVGTAPLLVRART